MTWTAPRTWVTGEVVTSTIMNTHLRDNLIAVLPVGAYVYRAAVGTAVETSVEGRFLECNGVAVSRTTYSALFNYLNGLTPALPFGAGNGTSTFNIPDLRGRLAVGHSPSGAALIDTLGENDGRAQNLRNISHFHTADAGSAGAGIPVHAWSATDSAHPIITSGDLNNPNYPAFIVGGVWYIKYTS